MSPESELGARQRFTLAHDHGGPPVHLVAVLLVVLLAAPLTAFAASSPSLTVSPTAVPAGDVVKVSGLNFPANTSGQLQFDSGSSPMPKYRTNKSGSFAASFTVPAAASIGTHLITAQSTSKRTAALTVSASASLDVTEAAPTVSPSPTDPPGPTADPGPTPDPGPTLIPPPSLDPSLPPLVDPQPSFPVRATFYYPWFPEAWNQQGMNPFTNYHPSLGEYDSSAASVVALHVAAMQYARIDVGIASWWGQGSRTDGRLPTILAATTGSSFRWSVYYEAEAQGDPSAAQLAADLQYLRDRYGSDPSFYRVNGRFVVFVYADGADGCGMVDRWTQANAGIDAYIVLKVFSGYRTCASQPSAWHQYSPAVASDSQSGFSYSISPGFDKANETAPRLARDLSRWNQNVRDMVASGAPFQLVTTFDEWGEGTAVESADEWASPSGFGAYLDALHADGTGPSSTPAPPSPTPNTTPPPPTDGDVTLLAAGDIAGCSSSGDDATANLLSTLTGTIITAGDNAYDSGTPTEFLTCFDPTWGRFKDRIRPAPGNHEYLTAGAAGYYGYFGAIAGDPAKGYYAFDLGSWRIYAINSNCSAVGGCGAGSPQETWLRNDLAANPRSCALAYWHHPRFSSGQHGSYVAYQPLWQDLYDARAEIVVNGHDHDYERFAPQTPAGSADGGRGIREFVVGTGGKNHYPFSGTFIANSETHNDDTFGILRLTLQPDGYSWQFIPEGGKSFSDAGSGTCH